MKDKSITKLLADRVNCPICNNKLKYNLSMSYYDKETIEEGAKTNNFVRELQNMFFWGSKVIQEERKTKDVIKTQKIELSENNLNDFFFSEQGLHLNLIDKTYFVDKSEDEEKQESLTYFDEIKLEGHCYNEELQANEYFLSGNIWLSEIYDRKIKDDEIKLLNTLETRKLGSIKAFHDLNSEKTMKQIVSDPNLTFEVITLFEVEEDNTISVAKITNLFNKFKTIINIKSNQLDKLNIEQEQKENGKIISSKIEQELTDNSYWKLNNSHRALTRIKTLFALR